MFGPARRYRAYNDYEVDKPFIVMVSIDGIEAFCLDQNTMKYTASFASYSEALATSYDFNKSTELRFLSHPGETVFLVTKIHNNGEGTSRIFKNYVDAYNYVSGVVSYGRTILFGSNIDREAYAIMSFENYNIEMIKIE